VKVILDNELEKWAWGMMMRAHHKWEKNHCSLLQAQMECFFFYLFKEETYQMIDKEVEAMLMEAYGPEGLDVI